MTIIFKPTLDCQVMKPKDGSSRTRYYGDSRLGVYISPVPWRWRLGLHPLKIERLESPLEW